ncbi:hypothetical protein ACLMAJ_29510 [Nocardia sp. KC 131]|uniref:hypothetical protein n=1 Tax=Nocardia arseniciresistens TaxID=3392119 RepID=UPI00398E6503
MEVSTFMQRSCQQWAVSLRWQRNVVASTHDKSLVEAVGGRSFMLFRVERSEAEALAGASAPVAILIGDSGTGKSFVLQDAQRIAAATFLAPAPVSCSYETGALQAALLDSLASALAIGRAGRSQIEQLGREVKAAALATASEVGKNLAKAIAKELLAFVKGKIGAETGDALAHFVKELRTSNDAELRRDILSRSDATVVREIARLAEQVAEALNRDIVLAIDDANRLSDEDRRILASLAARSSPHFRIVAAWSTAAPDASGIAILQDAGATVFELTGLSPRAVGQWMDHERIDSAVAAEVHSLTAGYPLLIEGMLAHLEAGGDPADFRGSGMFVRVLDAALDRLSPNAQHAARMLAAFNQPPRSDRIATYMGVTAIEWGTIRRALTRERILTTDRDGMAWFHEQRRAHLWDVVLDDQERREIGQKAYDELIDEFEANPEISAGLVVRIARMANYAHASQDRDPMLAAVVALDLPDIAVAAASIELTSPSELAFTTADAILVHARNMFGAEGNLIRSLDKLRTLGLAVATEGVASPGVPSEQMRIDPNFGTGHAITVLHGRIQGELRKVAVPNLAEHVTRTHLEKVRLESTSMTFAIQDIDTNDLIALIDDIRPPLMRGAPGVAIRARFGEQPFFATAVFNNQALRTAALGILDDLNESSFGRTFTVDKVVVDPSEPIPSVRFFRALNMATGLQMERSQSKWWMRTDITLPINVFAWRQLEAMRFVRSQTGGLEREALGLDRAIGIGVAEVGDTTYWADLRGLDTVLVKEIPADQSMDSPYTFYNLERLFALKPGQSIMNFTTEVRGEPRIEDPVVDLFSDLWENARRFNKTQPRRKVPTNEPSLTEHIRASHVRDQEVARRLSETITIGGHRGHRDMTALRLAIHTRRAPTGLQFGPALAVFPPGSPDDVKVALVDGTGINSADHLLEKAFGSINQWEFPVAGPTNEVIATLLGHEPDEIQLTR